MNPLFNMDELAKQAANKTEAEKKAFKFHFDAFVDNQLSLRETLDRMAADPDISVDSFVRFALSFFM